MKTIAGFIRAGRLVKYQVSNGVPDPEPDTRNPAVPLRNCDLDFIGRRDRMQANGDDTSGNCINFFAAKSYRDSGEMDRVHNIGK